jgi:hypothetical protein
VIVSHYRNSAYALVEKNEYEQAIGQLDLALSNSLSVLTLLQRERERHSTENQENRGLEEIK